ncbi:hypothetical protein N9X87_00535 [bacterium]|nr:hypothetical protein [bacterium]
MSAIVYPVRTIALNIFKDVEQALPSEAAGYIFKDPWQIKTVHPLAFTVLPLTPTTTYQNSEELDLVIQRERWNWIVYLLFGSGDDNDEILMNVETYLSKVMKVLVGESPEPYSGELERTSAGFYGFIPNGSVWGVALWHDRNTGEEP